MDRFIVKSFLAGVFIYLQIDYLKSNMDRFIGKEIILTADMDEKFKIQYG